MVQMYLLPLGCLLLNFLAFAACLRFLFSRQGLYWIIPLALTLFMSWPHALTLYRVASDSSTTTLPYSYLDLQPLMLSLLWYAMIVTFHYALKKTIRVNLYAEQVKKNLHEARHLQAGDDLERLRRDRRWRRHLANRAVPVRLGLYGAGWTDLFDQA